MPLVFSKKNIITLLVIIIAIVIVAVGTYLVRYQFSKEEANQAKNTLFASGAETPYVDQNGTPTSLDSYLGKIIVVNSWASWSPFSVQELQDLNEIAGEYKDKNVVILAVNRKENRDQSDRFLATLPPLPYIRIVTDTKDYFYNAVGGYAMPETLIYNQAGTIVEHTEGVQSKDDLRTILDSLNNN